VQPDAVVLDTNVWVAAGFRRGSDSAYLVEQIRQDQLRLVWNEATRGETEYILRKIPPLSWDAIAPLFREENRYSGGTEPERFGHVPDPADRKFAALAEAAGATLISMDEHLLAGRHQTAIPILTPREFLQRESADREHGPASVPGG
jgi:predicted nucleic acid-binding protein